MDLTLQPDCLRWARERAGLSTSELAEKMGLKEERIVEWEQSGELTLSRAEKLAEKTHTPLGYLFLPNAPTDNLPINDFRTVQAQDIEKPSVDLIDVINAAIQRQEWYRNYILVAGGSTLDFVGSLDKSMDVIEAANQIRNVVSWGANRNTQASSWENTLTGFISAVRETGVLVMRSGIVGNNTRRTLEVSEFRGFALSDAYAPLIFINGNDAKAAQIFTLAHELAHIWLGETGVSNLRLMYSPNIEAERFCNAVAAEFLVPFEEITRLWENLEESSDKISRASKYFKVSKLVILRRLWDTHFISEEDFQTFYTDELTKITQASNNTESGGGDFYTNTRARFGDQFLTALISNTIEGGTTYREALDILGVSKIETLNNLAAEIGISS